MLRTRSQTFVRCCQVIYFPYLTNWSFKIVWRDWYLNKQMNSFNMNMWLNWQLILKTNLKFSVLIAINFTILLSVNLTSVVFFIIHFRIFDWIYKTTFNLCKKCRWTLCTKETEISFKSSTWIDVKWRSWYNRSLRLHRAK